MRKLFAIIWLLLVLVAAPCGAQTLLDDFSGGDGSLGGNWNSGYGSGRDCQVVSGVVENTAPGGSCWQTWAVNSYSGDQTGIVTIVTLLDASDYSIASILLRASDPPTRSAYRCFAISSGSTNKTIIQRVNAGTGTDLNSETSTTWTAGDELKCTITGTDPVTITVYQNGSSVLSTTDTSPLSSTLIGLSCYAADGTGYCEIDDFKTATAAPPAPTAGNIMVITVE